MIEVTDHLTRVRARIESAAIAAAREPGTIGLLAVTKGQTVERLRAAHQLGLRAFGENYVQEALRKQAQVGSAPIRWYFIGRIQSNKTRAIAENFDWVLSVDRARIGERLGTQRPTHLRPLNVCMQVKVQADPAKGGVGMHDARELAKRLADNEQLRLRGLMVIPPAGADESQTEGCYRQGAELFASLKRDFLGLDTLSMGMSGDLEQAIAHGSTLVRIGTDLFGARKL